MTLAYIVMEFVDGESLKAVLDRGERFPLSETMRIMEELLKGLGFSHERGVVHRDIKPANIMLTREGGVKIADFGIARIESSSMTQAGTVLGTPSYMSPEQFKGEPVDARTDIYSTGVVLYQLLTGEKPFEGSVSAIMHKVLTTTPPKPSELAVTAPPPFDAVVAKAMAKRPEERFATAASFAQAIRAAPAGAIAAAAAEEEGTIVASGAAPPGATPGATRGATPGAARTSTFAPLVATAPHRRPLPIWIGAVVILILVIGGGLWLFAFRVAQGPKSELVAAGGSASSPRAAIAAAEAPAPAPAAPPKGTPTPTAPASSPAPQAHPARHEAASAAASPAPASPLPSTAGVTTQPAAPANPTAPTTATPPPAPASTASTVAPGAAPGAAPLPVPPPPEPPPEPPPSAAAAPSTPAPAPVAPAPAPTKLANIAASPEAIAKSVAAAIAPVSCSLVSGSVATAETITLTGLAGNQAPAQLHQVLADAAPSAAVNWNVTTFSGGAAATYCRALNLLRPIATPFGAAQQGLQLALESGRTVLADGDP
ncbi:MAG: protein kinase domain-containing protein, partial [Acetobacteraceae bacterium]